MQFYSVAVCFQSWTEAKLIVLAAAYFQFIIKAHKSDLELQPPAALNLSVCELAKRNISKRHQIFSDINNIKCLWVPHQHRCYVQSMRLMHNWIPIKTIISQTLRSQDQALHFGFPHLAFFFFPSQFHSVFLLVYSFFLFSASLCDCIIFLSCVSFCVRLGFDPQPNGEEIPLSPTRLHNTRTQTESRWTLSLALFCLFLLYHRLQQLFLFSSSQLNSHKGCFFSASALMDEPSRPVFVTLLSQSLSRTTKYNT